jgi:hypothetical protein
MITQFITETDLPRQQRRDHLDRFHTRSIRRKVALEYENDFEAFGYPP